MRPTFSFSNDCNFENYRNILLFSIAIALLVDIRSSKLHIILYIGYSSEIVTMLPFTLIINAA